MTILCVCVCLYLLLVGICYTLKVWNYEAGKETFHKSIFINDNQLKLIEDAGNEMQNKNLLVLDVYLRKICVDSLLVKVKQM